MYLRAKCLELTLELSQNKWPPAETLSQLFKDNLPALLAFHLEAAFGGVRYAFPGGMLPFTRTAEWAIHQEMYTRGMETTTSHVFL
jgi:hypothetical protein